MMKDLNPKIFSWWQDTMVPNGDFAIKMWDYCEDFDEKLDVFYVDEKLDVFYVLVPEFE